ncbi:hypothetical protein [Caballeronia sp. GAWG2-1]|uniref:hypothetical protein n=1 Tax=Caballeronia sp. GAWG2-1 TaxID=2921744 RepID=UPI00202912FF|nr:hypothetical protein [Caballeronia sp. GAWG2-1]
MKISTLRSSKSQIAYFRDCHKLSFRGEDDLMAWVHPCLLTATKAHSLPMANCQQISATKSIQFPWINIATSVAENETGLFLPETPPDR